MTDPNNLEGTRTPEQLAENFRELDRIAPTPAHKFQLMISAMTTDQATIIIRESIREAASQCGCKPSDAHRPTQGNKPGLKARNIAIRLARAQGIPVHFLAHAFTLSRETIQKALRDEVSV